MHKDYKPIRRAKKSMVQILFGRTAVIMILLAVHFFLLFGLLMKLTSAMPYYIGGMTALAMVMLVYILNTRSDASVKLSWSVLIAVAPLFGTLLYWFVRIDPGRRVSSKIDKRTVQESKKYTPDHQALLQDIQKKEPSFYGTAYYLQNACGLGICDGRDAVYFPLGENMFKSMLFELNKARKYIFMEYFIIDDGYMWNSILDILKRKAAEGVEVRVMFDGTCTFARLPAGYPKILKKMGIHCKVVSPVKLFLSTYHNNRDHRKILSVDGKVAYTGGINLSDEYINRTHPYGHWKDTGVMVRGQAARSFTLMFLQMWNSTERLAEYDRYLPPLEEEPNPRGYILPFSDTPTDSERVGQTVYMQMIGGAKRTMYIMTPYLILDGEMLTALCQCAKRGVDTRIILPAVPDHKYAYVLAKRHFGELMDAGVKIYTYTPGFIHAKVLLADGEEAVVGSINLDYRSLYLHYECGAYFHKTPVLPDIALDFKNTFGKSHLLTFEDLKDESFLSKLSGAILKAVAPLM